MICTDSTIFVIIIPLLMLLTSLIFIGLWLAYRAGRADGMHWSEEETEEVRAMR